MVNKYLFNEYVKCFQVWIEKEDLFSISMLISISMLFLKHKEALGYLGIFEELKVT